MLLQRSGSGLHGPNILLFSAVPPTHHGLLRSCRRTRSSASLSRTLVCQCKAILAKCIGAELWTPLLAGTTIVYSLPQYRLVAKDPIASNPRLACPSTHSPDLLADRSRSCHSDDPICKSVLGPSAPSLAQQDLQLKLQLKGMACYRKSRRIG